MTTTTPAKAGSSSKEATLGAAFARLQGALEGSSKGGLKAVEESEQRKRTEEEESNRVRSQRPPPKIGCSLFSPSTSTTTTKHFPVLKLAPDDRDALRA